MRSGVAWSPPASVVAASPGVAYVSEKTTTLTRKSTGIERQQSPDEEPEHG